jgi:hypothetical protein
MSKEYPSTHGPYVHACVAGFERGGGLLISVMFLQQHAVLIDGPVDI